LWVDHSGLCSDPQQPQYKSSQLSIQHAWAIEKLTKEQQLTKDLDSKRQMFLALQFKEFWILKDGRLETSTQRKWYTMKHNKSPPAINTALKYEMGIKYMHSHKQWKKLLPSVMHTMKWSWSHSITELTTKVNTFAVGSLSERELVNTIMLDGIGLFMLNGISETERS
jgi:hypothetical protein